MFRWSSILLALALFLVPASGHPESIALTSLEWPPYTGADLEGFGASAQVLGEALQQVGAELEVTFLPWQRAVKMAKHDDAFVGYFPEYHAESIEEDFFFSDPIGTSLLGFIERTDNPVQWNSLEDLTPYTIGVVSGYVNTAEFDAMMAAGELNTDGVIDDATNIKKVAAGRIDMAVMDKFVFLYLLKTDPDLHALADRLQFNEKLLEVKKLYVCLKKTPAGQAAMAIINTGLSSIDATSLQDALIAEALGD
jgi:polar amino acid transport system substrate-binding protein